MAKKYRAETEVVYQDTSISRSAHAAQALALRGRLRRVESAIQPGSWP